MTAPEISVIIPTYNRGPLLPRALDSVLAQTFGDWEIVLIDDGSTDDTIRVVDDYGRALRDRLVYVRQPNAGSSSARNRGIEACRGRFVAFLDSDDEFLHTKLERQRALFKLRPELGFVYSDYAFIDLQGRRHESAFDTVARRARDVPKQTIAPGLCVCTPATFDTLLRGYFIATIVGMVRSEVLAEGIRFPVGHAYAEEWLFYLRVLRACKAGFVDEPLSLHHYTPGSLARTDKRRNSLGYYDLLLAIDTTFDDLSSAQRRAVHRNLGSACRQTAYDASRAGEHGLALRRFVESLRFPGRGHAFGPAIMEAIRCFTRVAVPDPTSRVVSDPELPLAPEGSGEVAR